MRTSYDKTLRILLPVVAGVGCMLVLLSAGNAFSELGQAAPHLGDIVSFTTPPLQPVDGNARLIVQRPDQASCILDLSVLRTYGGSLVVESQINDARGSLRVHWAGARTSDDIGNCGDKSDLILEWRDLDTLAVAAGGYGAVQRRLPVFAAVGDSEIAAYSWLK